MSTFFQRFILVLLLTSCLLLANVLVAQLPTGSIQGTVTDQTGAVLSGAKVTITNQGTGQVTTLTTSSAGSYTSGSLLPGSYAVRIEAKGFRTLTATLPVQVGVVTSGNFALTIGQESQTIEVASSAVMVNTEQPTVQGVLTARQIDNLPIGGRNFLDLAQLEPGVQIQDGGNFDPTKNGFSSISFGGRYGRTARITLDGIDISDETVGTTTQNIAAGAIQEFQLSQSSLDMSTELTSSGAVNVVTKSGTNSVHGDGFYLFRDKSMMANFPGGQDTYNQRNYGGGSLGGPVIKDKLFFYATTEHAKQSLQVPLAPPAPFTNIPKGYPADFRDLMTLGRLDYNLKNAKLFYRFTYESNSDVRAYGGTYQAFANRDNTPAHGLGADFSTGTFNHSIRFGWLKFQNHIADAVTGNPGIYDPGAPANIAIRVGGASTITRFGPSRLAPQATFQNNIQLKYDGSKLSGAHIFRYGISYNRIRGGGFAAFYDWPEARTLNSFGLGCDPAEQLAAGDYPCASQGPFPGGASNPLNYPTNTIVMGNGQGFYTEKPGFNFPAGGQWDDRLGLYFGDTWKVKPNFTLTMGLRWSRDTGRADSDLPPMTCDQIVAANFTVDGTSYVPCTGKQPILDQFGTTGIGGQVRQPNSNFGPQFGFAWDPRKNGKTVVRGGAGLYYENAVFNNVLFDRPARLAQGLFWASNSSVCPKGQLVLPDGTTLTTIGGVNIATGVCGQPIGSVMGLVSQMASMYRAATAAAGAQANPNFLGAVLSSGNSYTGNGFIASDYRTPRSIQMNIGVQHEIRKGTVLSADFIRNIGEHYLLTYDTNHVGDARYLNRTAALNAIAATTSSFGCAGGSSATAINCAIAAGASIGDFADNGLDSGKTYLSGTPASYNGLTPDFGAAFPGINPLVGENEMLFPIGRSVYNGLQVKLVQSLTSPVSFINQANLQVSYSLSRFNTMAADQDFIPYAEDYRNPTKYMGPESLDRTNQISFGGTFDIAHGPRVSFVSHFYSPLATTLRVQNGGRSGELFFTDWMGDGGEFDHIVPGLNLGAFGRSVNAGNINQIINNYNNTVGGTLLPAAQALVNAGLFTADQLKQLGAVADYLALAPNDQMNMSWVHAFDLKFGWPIKVGERMTLEPSIGFYNLFNFANFNSASSSLSGSLVTCSSKPASFADCGGDPGAANGTALSDLATKDSLRVGVGTGVNTSGSPRQIEWGLKLTF